MQDCKMLRPFIWLSILSICSGLPSQIFPQNVITVPPNCPVGQEWINGACRDVWNMALPNAELKKVTPDIETQNMITVPQNCPPGQQWINGQCRDVWRGGALPTSDIETQNMITVPQNCPPGQQWINGQCRDVWRGGALPTSDIETQNMITVPQNCPPGQQWINGQCRDVWRGGALPESKIFQNLVENLWAKSNHERSKRQEEDFNDDTVSEVRIESRNIISVPNQCPEGYKPDALGICRKQL